MQKEHRGAASLKYWKRKAVDLEFYTQWKMSFKNKGKIKFVSKTQQLRELIANRSVEMLEIFQAKGMWYQTETQIHKKEKKNSRNAKNEPKVILLNRSKR